MAQGGIAIMEAPPVGGIPFAAEVQPPANLLQEFGQTEVTLFGHTGNLEDLVDLCPVAKDPTRMTPEAVNRFAAKILDMAGIEIPDRYSHLLPDKSLLQTPKKLTDTHENENHKKAAAAVERIEPRPSRVDDVSARAKQQQPLAAGLPEPPIQKPVTAPLPEEMFRRIEILAESDHATTRPAIEPSQLKEQLLPVAARPLEPLPLLRMHHEQLFPAEPYMGVAAKTESKESGEEVEPETREQIGDGKSRAKERLDQAALILPEPPEFAEMAVPYNEEFPSTSVEEAPESVFDAQHEWMVQAVNTTPSEVYGAFTTALAELAGPTSRDKAEETMPLGCAFGTGASEHSDVMATAPPICSEVADKLLSLLPEEQEIALPVVKNITEAIQEVRLLEVVQATSEEIDIAKERLTELCVELFQAVGIEYDEQKIEQFVQIILSPSFMPVPPTLEKQDLEHRGTHEVKRHFPQLYGVFANLAHLPVHYILGKFTLAQAHSGLLGAA